MNLRLKDIPLGENYEGVADRTKLKVTIMQGDTAASIKKNLNSLQTALQNTGKLQIPSPSVLDFEKNLLDEVNFNPYSKSLLYMILASSKRKTTD